MSMLRPPGIAGLTHWPLYVDTVRGGADPTPILMTLSLSVPTAQKFALVHPTGVAIAETDRLSR